MFTRRREQAPTGFSHQQHLDSYKQHPQLAPSTRQASHGTYLTILRQHYSLTTTDGTTYDTVFQSMDGNTLIMRVHCPPNALPSFTLYGVDARHPWLNRSSRVVGYEPVASMEAWKKSKLLLGSAVQTVVQHFQLHPPDILQFVDSTLLAAQRNPKLTTKSRSRQQSPPPPPPKQQKPAVPRPNFPTIPQSLSELETLDLEQLEKLCQDDLEFRVFCNKLSVTSDYHNLQRPKITATAQRAQKNLDLQDNLQLVALEVKQLQETLADKISEFQKLEAQQDQLCQAPDVLVVRKQLKVAKREAFEHSERIAEDYDMEDAKLLDFCDEFLAARKVHHVRAAKLEILEHTQR